MAYNPRKNRPKRRRRRKNLLDYEKKPDCVYFEGKVADILPGTKFKVKIERDKLEDLILVCDMRSILKAKRIRAIRGDGVLVEVDPTTDLSKGLIVSIMRTFNNRPPINK